MTAFVDKLTSPVSVTPVKTSETTTRKSWTIDSEGNAVPDSVYTETSTVTYVNDGIAATPIAVVNKAGAELPSTSGIGTTILYIICAVLVIGAGVFLVTKRRMRKEDDVQE